MQQGGWDMWLLLLISIVGLAVVIERLVFFQSRSMAIRKVCCARSERRSPPTISTARSKSARRTSGMLPRILEFGLRRGEKNRADITDALSIALMEHLNSLERNLGDHRNDRRHRAVRRSLRNGSRHHPRLPRHRAQGQLDAGRRRGRRFGSADHDGHRSHHRRHRRRVLQLLQVAHQELQPRDDRRGQSARRDAALPQHRLADSDRALPAVERPQVSYSAEDVGDREPAFVASKTKR